MTRRILLLNAGLLILLVAGIVKLRQDWISFESSRRVADLEPLPETLPGLPAAGVAPTASQEDWTEVPSRNPFSFDRSDIAVLPPPVIEGVQPGAKPVLFGTMAIGAARTAMMASAQAAGRGSRPVKVGEVVDGWTVLEIADKSVTVEMNGVRETVVMNDPTANIARSHARTIQRPAAATSVVRAAGSSATPVAVPPTADSEPPPAPASGAPSAQPTFRDVRTPFGTFRQRVD